MSAMSNCKESHIRKCDVLGIKYGLNDMDCDEF